MTTTNREIHPGTNPRSAAWHPAGIRPDLLDAQECIDIAVRFNANVLISRGDVCEREMLARRIHRESPHSDGPFVVLDHRSAWDLHLESLSLGSIFLEEVHDLSPRMQARLLKILQEAAHQRVDLRVMAGAADDLFDRVRSGDFSADLFYRLNVIHLVIR